MSIEENKRKVREFMQSIQDKDLDKMMTLMHPECMVWSAGSLWFSGWRPLAKMLEQTATGTLPQFPNGITFIMKDMTAEGDRVAAELESDGTHISGRHYHNYYHFLWRFKDGKIIEFKEYLDTALAGEVVGVEKPNL